MKIEKFKINNISTKHKNLHCKKQNKCKTRQNKINTFSENHSHFL